MNPPQRGNANTNYAALVKDRPPHTTRPPAGIPIGAVEICTFFPNWLLLPAVAMRFQQNGWSRKDAAKAQLHAHTMLTKDNLTSAENRIQKQFSEGGIIARNLPAGTHWSRDQATALGHQSDLTSAGWQLRGDYQNTGREVFGEICLADIRQQVPRHMWPAGNDRLILTQCLEFDEQYPYLHLDTSHIDWLVRTTGYIATPPGVAMDWTHDHAALTNVVHNIDDPTQ